MGDDKTKQKTYHPSEYIHYALRDLAHESGESISQILRLMVLEWFERRPEVYQSSLSGYLDLKAKQLTDPRKGLGKIRLGRLKEAITAPDFLSQAPPAGEDDLFPAEARLVAALRHAMTDKANLHPEAIADLLACISGQNQESPKK